MKQEEINESIIPKLQNIISKELKYRQLCEALNINYKYGNSKSHQLNQLSLYCDYDILDNPTRYIINRVYDDAIISQINGNNRFQDLFEGALYQALLNNNNQPLYVSNMELLNLFNEVNENFSYSCNEYYMKLLGGDYITLNEMSQIAYKILREWTIRRINQMEARRVIIKRQGFRLYSELNEYILTYNVPADSDTEKICQEIYDRAAKDTLPEDWHGEWTPAWRWENFEDRIKELVKEYFNGEYIDLKPINIIYPPREDYLREILNKIYEKIPELKNINDEAKKKIFETSQLNKFTGENRKMLIDVAIQENPNISLRQKIKERAF